MRRRRREFTVFTMTFLDVMASGFGAIIMVYLLVNHSVDENITHASKSLTAEVSMLEEDIVDGRINLVELRNALGKINDAIASARESTAKLIAQVKIEHKDAPVKPLPAVSQKEQVEKLKSEVAGLEETVKGLRGQGTGTFGGMAARAFAGEGNRQYLTGLKLGGEHIMILFDVSTSMLDDDLVNVLRRRNMSIERQKAAPKWKRAVATLEWVVSQLPIESKFQVYTFNTEAHSAIPGTDGKWLQVIGSKELDAAINTVHGIVPKGGTSLRNAFAAMQNMQPKPDNIYLITDGLPTQGANAVASGVISGRDREKLFREAVDLLPKGVPVNTILFEMDGDSNAAAAFWILAQRTAGAMLSPSKDWP